jgi:hypothetical protein
MKNLRSAAIIAFVAIALSSCGSPTIKKKMEGKWRWESIKQKSGDVLSMMDDELYFSFKDGLYLYTDVASGVGGSWDDASPFTIDEKSKKMTVTTKKGTTEKYEIVFAEDDHLHLIIDDADSPLFRDTWIMKKVKQND